MRIYGSISKVTEQDDGTLMVEGVASSGSVDSQGEVILPEAMKAAIPDYMKFANVREMHDSKKAAGVATELSVNSDGQSVLMAMVVDPIAITKVKSGVYKGFSIGGKVTSRDSADKSIITGITLHEISLVDRPANPDSVFSMYKVDSETDDDNDDAPPARDKDEEEITKTDDAPPADEVKKDAYCIANLASLASQLEYFAQSEQYDSDYDGTSSPIPAKARELAVELYDLLLTLVSEEVEEAKTRLYAAAAAVGDLQKTANVEVLTKTAAEQSEQLSKAAVDLAKAVDERDTLTKTLGELTTAHDELKKKYDALPAPPKGVLISKVNDRGEKEMVEVPLPADPAQRAQLLIKSAHQSGGNRIL